MAEQVTIKKTGKCSEVTVRASKGKYIIKDLGILNEYGLLPCLFCGGVSDFKR